MTNIFEYSNIVDLNIYSDIRSFVLGGSGCFFEARALVFLLLNVLYWSAKVVLGGYMMTFLFHPLINPP